MVMSSVVGNKYFLLIEYYSNNTDVACREPVMADWWKSSMPNILGIGAATITAGAALYMATRPQPFETPLDLTNQSQEVPVSYVVA